MQIEALAFHLLSAGTLVGYADFALGSSGLPVFDCSIHQKDDRWWIVFPRRSYVGRDNKTHWQTLLGFDDEDSQERFWSLALAALRFRYPEALAEIPVAAQANGGQP